MSNGQISGAISAAITLYATGGNWQAASWAYAIGSGIGTAVLDKMEGPKLQDTSVQISSYGAALGRHWGGVAVRGNIVWATNLIPGEHSESSGSGASTTVTTYRASWATVFGRGVMPGWRRIWLGAKLVCDLTGNADSAGQAASMRFLQDHVTWHSGAEDQMPDATIESYEGAGNVEAMRGVHYMVLRDVPLADYGNQIPIVRVELTTQEVVTISNTTLAPYIIGSWVGEDPPQHRLGMNPATTWYQFVGPSGNTTSNDFAVVRAAMLADRPTAVRYVSYMTSLEAQELYSQTMSTSLGQAQNPNSGGGVSYIYSYYGPDTPTDVVIRGASQSLGAAMLAYGALPGDEKVYVIENAGNEAVGSLFKVYDSYVGSTVGNYSYFNPMTEYGPIYHGSTVTFPSLYVHQMAVISAARVASIPAMMCAPGDPMFDEIVQVPGSPDLCMTAFGEYSLNTGFERVVGNYRQLQVAASDGIQITKKGLGPIIVQDSAQDTEAFWTAAAAAAGVTGAYGSAYPVTVGQAGVGSYGLSSVGAGTTTLAQIVSDICVEAGLLTSQIDVSALTDTVQGYSVGRVTTARAALEPLRSVWHFDPVESGGKIRFVKRGAAGSVLSLGFADLGAGVDGTTEIIEPTRAQEAELPAEISVSFWNREADYEVGTQRARRVTTGSRQQMAVELPLVLTDAQGAQVVDVLLRETWTSRTERVFRTTRAYAGYEPTDVFTVGDGELTYTVRVTERTENGMVIEWKGVDAAPSYSSVATGSPTSGGGAVVTFDGPTRLTPMDIPLLRDADNGAGYYLAASGFGPGWRGGRAYRSSDDINFVAVTEFGQAAVQGWAETVLAPWTGGNVVDERNSVDVTLHDGALSSISLAELLADGNPFLIGDELVQAQRATLLTGRTYRLAGLLRGRRGTEQHMGSHTVRERVVFLQASTVRRVGSSISAIGVATSMKGVTTGTSIDSALTVAFTETAASLKPLSPVHLAVARQPDGRYLARWTRRTRIGGEWANNTDASLGEAQEQYRVRVLDGSTVLSTQTVATTTANVGATFTGYSFTPGTPVLASDAQYLLQVGTDAYGVAGAGSAVKAIKFDSSGAQAAISSASAGNSILGACHGNSSIYVNAVTVAGGGGSSSGYGIRRYAYSDVTTVAASRLNDSDPVISMVPQYGYLWAITTGGTLLKLHQDTLATVNTFTFSGVTALYAAAGWLVAVSSSAIYRIAADGSQAAYTPITGSIKGVWGAGDYLWVVYASGGINRYRLSTARGTSPNQELGYPAGYITIAAGNDVLPLAQATGNVLIVPYSFYSAYSILLDSTTPDIATGAQQVTRGTYTSIDYPGAAVGQATVVRGASTGGLYAYVSSAGVPRPYTLTDLAPALDFTGKTMEVCQISDLVGPGFPATVTIT